MTQAKPTDYTKPTHYAPEEHHDESGAGNAEVVNTKRARQGVTGQNVRTVLVVGVVAVIVGFVIVYFGVIG